MHVRVRETVTLADGSSEGRRALRVGVAALDLLIVDVFEDGRMYAHVNPETTSSPPYPPS